MDNSKFGKKIKLKEPTFVFNNNIVIYTLIDNTLNYVNLLHLLSVIATI